MERLRGLVARAQARQELAPDIDLDVACALIAGPLFIWHLMVLADTDAALPADLADRFTSAILQGIGRAPQPK